MIYQLHYIQCSLAHFSILCYILAQDNDIYLLDDPMAAVDADVGQHIFSRCIMGLLRHKTRIVCTHHTQYLMEADTVVVLDDFRIVDIGE